MDAIRVDLKQKQNWSNQTVEIQQTPDERSGWMEMGTSHTEIHGREPSHPAWSLTRAGMKHIVVRHFTAIDSAKTEIKQTNKNKCNQSVHTIITNRTVQ